VIIPRSVEIVGESCFIGCPNVKEIVFEEGSALKEIGKDSGTRGKFN
jgi:hypothetical protein